MEGWAGDTVREPDGMAGEAERTDGKLTKAEKCAAFMAIVEAADAAGCRVGFARITGDGDYSATVSFTMTAGMIRATCRAFPGKVEEAERMLAL